MAPGQVRVFACSFKRSASAGRLAIVRSASSANKGSSTASQRRGRCPPASSASKHATGISRGEPAEPQDSERPFMFTLADAADDATSSTGKTKRKAVASRRARGPSAVAISARQSTTQASSIAAMPPAGSSERNGANGAAGHSARPTHNKATAGTTSQAREQRTSGSQVSGARRAASIPPPKTPSNAKATGIGTILTRRLGKRVQPIEGSSASTAIGRMMRGPKRPMAHAAASGASSVRLSVKAVS